ncbi:carbohydrate ABC transporter permease [Pseudonocardia abyssalis]|uniref:Sugar ABC transporter permease n=1 Tax=Pseudonocardia abyssalis TaxID=2792008 RepID=A0ABS6UKV4_9PSEU|nr:sugar ABC transporter permease [Pseudonocardia abyssalis]MBW0117108.1 sugar ABC transporter permease [Pseudonocardia abyssalis]MBW0132858.1 sugar ABC transporter permease [Pseudonocardia abyssalis]
MTGARPYLAPLVLALAVWVYGPLVWTGALSLLDWDLTSPDPEFVGWGNFAALAADPRFADAVARTGLYVLGMLPFATVVPLGLAILLWRRPGRASHVYRALLFAPVVLAPVATAISWRFVLHPLQGVANTVLGALGLPTPNWLGDPATALPVIVAITAGKIVALNLLLFGAALAGLDRRLVDAARVEGATEAEITRHVVLPQLTRTTAGLALLCVVVAGQWVFTNVALLTDGGPDGSTDNVYHWLYTTGFTFFDAGRASAAAVVVLAALALLFGAGALLRRRAS